MQRCDNESACVTPYQNEDIYLNKLSPQYSQHEESVKQKEPFGGTARLERTPQS